MRAHEGTGASGSLQNHLPAACLPGCSPTPGQQASKDLAGLRDLEQCASQPEERGEGESRRPAHRLVSLNWELGGAWESSHPGTTN